MSESPWRRVAFHEAGHAFAAHRLGVPIEWIRLQRILWKLEGPTKVSERLNPARGTMDWGRIMLGGPVAEAVHLGLEGLPDNEECLREWQEVVRGLGEGASGKLLAETRNEVTRPENWDRIDALARRLLDVHHLSGPQASGILGPDV